MCLAVFLYVLMFSIIAKLLSAPFDFVGFRLEHQYHLSNQKLRSWLWDECKGWLVNLVLGAIMVEIVYAIIRIAPQRWWIIAWAVFVGLFLLMAQLAPGGADADLLQVSSRWRTTAWSSG